MSAPLPGPLVAELEREPGWMYAWQLGKRRAPTLHPVLESIHATRAALIEREVRSVLAAAGPSARAIDLACCEGWFAHRLLEWGASEVVGVDIREQSVHRAELVRDYLGLDAGRLRFEAADVLELVAEDLGEFDVVLCLGLIYHMEHPMGALRVARALTRGLCVVESQTARVETPALFGFGSRLTFEATDAVIAVHHEADHASNPLASFGGALSFCPNLAAMRLMTAAAGFAEVERVVPGDGHDPDFHTGDRAVLFARPG